MQKRRRGVSIQERTTACEECGYPIAQRHHLISFADYGNLFDNETKNLCANCHELFHLLDQASEFGSDEKYWEAGHRDLPPRRTRAYSLVVYMQRMAKADRQRMIRLANMIAIVAGSNEKEREYLGRWIERKDKEAEGFRERGGEDNQETAHSLESAMHPRKVRRAELQWRHKWLVSFYWECRGLLRTEWPDIPTGEFEDAATQAESETNGSSDAAA